MSKDLVGKTATIVKIYNTVAKLKELPRAGWGKWQVKRERLESVAEHIFGTCLLAMLIDSEFAPEVDINRVLKMLVLHELDELVIGDITPYDGVRDYQKTKQLGKNSAVDILSDLVKADEHTGLVQEYNRGESPEAKFAKQCDKLEAVLQAKLYDSETDIFSLENRSKLKADHLKELAQNPQAKLSDTFLAYCKSQKSFSGLFRQIINEIKKG